MDRRKQKKWVIRAFLVIFATVSSVLVLEICLRILGYHDKFENSPIWHRVPDEILGWRLEEGARYQYLNPEFSTLVEYSSAGWRDREHALEKKAGVFRIVVLGDSFMEAYSVDFEDCFSAVLERELQASEREVEVINLGVGGYGTLQEVLALEEHGLQYQPDLIILAFYTENDLMDNSKELQGATLRENDLKVSARPFLEPGDGWNVSQVNYHRAEEEFRRKRTWLNRTAIGQKWLQRSSGASRPLSNAEAAILRFKVYSSLSSVDYDAAWLITRRILERLKSDASRHEAEILIMTVPALIETDEGYRTKGLAELKTSSDEIGKDIPQKRLGKIAKELQIPFLDLTADFREQEAEPGTQLFRGYDLHWNAQGHRLAASRVVDRIRRDFLADVR